jgi:hypothetical protein
LGDQDDADVVCLEALKAAEASRHRITMAKFETCCVAESNMLDPAVRDFYEHLTRRAKGGD